MRKIIVFVLIFSFIFQQRAVCAEDGLLSENLQDTPAVVTEPLPESEEILNIPDENMPSHASKIIDEEVSIEDISDFDSKKLTEDVPDNKKPIQSSSDHVPMQDTKTLAPETIPLQKSDPLLPLPKTQNVTHKKSSVKSKDIIFNEILADPESGSEFIEIYNTTNHAIDMDNWHLCDLSTYNTANQRCDKTKTSTYTFSHTKIESHTLLTIYAKTHFKFGLNNTNEEIFIEDDSENIVDHFAYKTSHKGKSWNADPVQWYEEAPTPNAQNVPSSLNKQYPAIVLNEIFPHPKDDPDNNEFIEIYNPLEEDVSLSNWKITDGSKSGSFTFSFTSFTPCITKPDTCLTIPKKGFLTVYRHDFTFALNDSGEETVTLIAPNDKKIFTRKYKDSTRSLSLNRATEWYWAEPTPGKENAIDPHTQTYSQLLLTEIFPNPDGEENMREYIEVYNPLDLPVNLKNWTLHDASASGNYVFSEDLFIDPHNYRTIYRKEFIFALNNSKETVSLIAPNEHVMSMASYDTSRENISYSYDLINKKWRWTTHLTPGKKNILNDLPLITQIKISPIAYKNVYTTFTAHATDPNNENLRVRWDFGDEHRSYLWTTRHKYTREGMYHGSLRIQDASEEVVQNFTITVKKYPKHHLIISKILPNPSGKDAGVEYVIIHNRSKENIDLYGWSIATGSSKKTLVNHPVHRKLTIKKGTIKMITNKYAAITLPNKTGVIELRRPDGSVADHLSYGNTFQSIKNDASFELISDTWVWNIPEDALKKQKAQTLIMRAIENEKSLYQQQKDRDIAYNKIHHPKEDMLFLPLEHKRHASFIKNLQKINAFFAIYLPYIQEKIIVFLNHYTEKKAPYTVYKVAHVKDRCTIPPLFGSEHAPYNFCIKKNSF